jgi:hypothetical protein
MQCGLDDAMPRGPCSMAGVKRVLIRPAFHDDVDVVLVSELMHE